MKIEEAHEILGTPERLREESARAPEVVVEACTLAIEHRRRARRATLEARRLVEDPEEREGLLRDCAVLSEEIVALERFRVQVGARWVFLGTANVGA